jgi:hypothetical protein
MTDMLATAAGALAETAVKTVAKRVRKTIVTPARVKKVAKTVATLKSPRSIKQKRRSGNSTASHLHPYIA